MRWLLYLLSAAVLTAVGFISGYLWSHLAQKVTSSADKNLLNAYKKIQNRLPDSIGFAALAVVTLSAFLLATILSIKLTGRVFCGGKVDVYAALGELLLVIVIAVGEVIAFLELRHIAKYRDFHSWVELQRVWTDVE